MQIETTLQRLCVKNAYYAYPKVDDEFLSQKYVIALQHFNRKMPNILSVEVSEEFITIEDPNSDPILYPLRGW